MAKPPSPDNKMPGYRIPQKAYDVSVNVPTEIADDSDNDPKVRLSAVQAIRLAIDQYYEILWFEEQRLALKQGSTVNEVIVVEDETFFGNNLHAQDQNANEKPAGPSPGHQTDDPPS
ncbi:hypothetical protein AB1K70_19360 [Bremerella sp. JC770]|uniref:hypothetical protein n=1 Tax=Bremerella sp. JC770 TaxID=3232137 RepID=UPI003459461B